MEKTIKVAQIIGKLYGGGVEKVIFNYYRAIDKSKVQFDFFYDADSTVTPPEDLIDMGTKFYKLPPYQKLWLYAPKLYKILKNNHYDIVHSNLNTISVFPLLIAKIARIPIRIAHNHSVPSTNEGLRTVLKYSLRPYTKIIANHYFACSEKAGRWLFGDKLYNQGKVKFIPNAVFFEKFNTKDVDSLRSELGISNDEFVVGHVGRLTFAKNHSLLLKIFKDILKVKKNAKLIIVGDGELSAEINNLIDQMGLRSKVIMIGHTDNPEKYYSLMKVFILPSYFEGLSMATIEAEISKIPVVVSQAVPEEANISNNFYQLSLDEDTELWAKTAIMAAQKTTVINSKGQIYDIKKAAPKLLNLYQRIIKNSKMKLENPELR
ncbi:glycosyltransferase [Limosilactobacillus reuteri]|uniref:glycosyltransferase n=1 Tax=Limosilactobacillus reuteri TaxID=1598 RepID=UPI001E4FC6A7|nr:glycosyltransferase [Limosilactobacillus reuteri]MCC4404971.1 glycosyltransferase [Limosilactobacillus reuteri]